MLQALSMTRARREVVRPRLSSAVGLIFCFFRMRLVLIWVILGVVGGVGALILIPIIVYFVVRCSRRNKDKGSPLQYQETPIVHWKILPTSVTYDPSASTGSTVRSNIPFQPYVSVSLAPSGGVKSVG